MGLYVVVCVELLNTRVQNLSKWSLPFHPEVKWTLAWSCLIQFSCSGDLYQVHLVSLSETCCDEIKTVTTMQPLCNNIVK